MRNQFKAFPLIPAGTVHAAKNVGADTASELATCVVEESKPLLTLK
jgi:hypothetical protein